jgi:hypothetical protein
MQSVINDIARRLATSAPDMARPTAAWQMQRLTESGKVYENALEELSKLTGKSEATLRAMFEAAGVKAMRFDDRVYKMAGLEPLPLNLSPAMAQVLAIGLQKTNQIMRNLTLTTANAGQQAFLNAADLAYMQVTGGAMSVDQAIRSAVKKVAADGLTGVNFAGRTDQLDVAMRRTVLTGVNQTTAKLQTTRATEMGCDLVQTSAHAGARPTHQEWQGKIFSRSGTDSKYPDFVASTGYGTVTGLCGVNCRHSFYPFFSGISENAYNQAMLDEMADKKVTYNGQELGMYEATQQQRLIERKIRYWKRQKSAMEAAGLNSTPETEAVQFYQGQMRSFIKQTGTNRQRVREQI